MGLGIADINTQIEAAILGAIPGAQVHVAQPSGGHFTIEVVSAVFEGKSSLAKQRLVYSAIKELMAGDHAPVHAVDTLITRVP
jgi:acid stress-induced BolA-like protein IbaG/YrbA